MKKKPPKVYARALYEAVHNLRGQELAAAIARFVALLARAGMIKKSGRIINEFVKYGKEQEGIVSIEITSSRELAAATLNSVKKVFGDKVEDVEKIDAALLGGIVVRTKDTILDGSLRTQLAILKMRLSN